MRVFENEEVNVPTSDVSRKDFKIMLEMIALTIIVLVITFLV